MKKDKVSGSLAAAENYSVAGKYTSIVRRTVMICEEETVLDHISNDHMLERLHQYAGKHKKHK